MFGLPAELTHGRRPRARLGLWGAGLCNVTDGRTFPEAAGCGKMKVGIDKGVLGESLFLGRSKGDKVEFCSGVEGGEETGVESKHDVGDELVVFKEFVKGFDGRGG